MINTALEASKLPPQDPELEQAVLGAMMLGREALYDVQDIIRPESFYVDAHRRICEAIMYQFHRDDPADILSVTMRLKATGELDIVGGAFYISQLTNKVASSANVQYHARLLAQLHLKREIIRISAEASQEGYDETTDSFDVIDAVSIKIDALRLSYETTRISKAGEHVTRLLDKDQKATFKKVGIPEIDTKVVLYNGRTHVIAARPGVGKSILAIQMAWNLTELGPVAYFSLEMPAEEVTARILASESGVPYGTILRQDMSQQEYDNVHMALGRIEKRLNENMIVDDTEALTPIMLASRLERLHRKHGLQAYFVDYLQLMSSGDEKLDRLDPYKVVSYCSRGCMTVAKKLNIPGVVLSQFNREIEKRTDKRPKLSDLRESGQIEQDAAVIGLMYRPGANMPDPPWVDRLSINWAKHRGGGTGETVMSITPAYNRIGGAPIPEPSATPAGGHLEDDNPF